MDSKKDAKDLLLADYRHISDSFWKNEQTGETRVNIFIGFVTLVAGALVHLTGQYNNFQNISRDLLFVIILSSLAALLVLGVITFARTINRNKKTDEYKEKLDNIRQFFKDFFDQESILLHYKTFADTHKNQARRKFGGIAHLVAAMNSMIIAAFAPPVIFYYNIRWAEMNFLLLGAILVILFGISFIVHLRFTR